MVAGAKEWEGYLADFAQLASNGNTPAPPWMRELRRTARDRFTALGFPTTRHEEWKYTNVAPIARSRFERAESTRNGLTAERLAPFTFGEQGGTRLVFVDGRYAPALSALPDLPDGMMAGSLAGVLTADSTALEPHLARYAACQDHAFVALNTACMEDGAFVSVPAGTAVPKPIHLLFVTTAPEKSTVSQPRNLILMGGGSRAMIVESYVGLGPASYFTNAVTEIVIGESAVLTHDKLVEETDVAFHIATTQAQLDRSAVFTSRAITLSGALVRNDTNAVLAGEGGDCTLDGLYLLHGRQHADNHTRIDHEKPHGSSRELYKGILAGRSKGVFSGKIYVHQDAQKTDAKQTNKNLLLSEDAVINTKPQLEILADDVKCAHGSTIGRLDEDAIFYLRSRGLGLEAARGLLTYAFASEVVSRITIAPLQGRLDRLLMARLQSLDGWSGASGVPA